MCNKIMFILVLCFLFFAFSCSITVNGDDSDYALEQDKYEEEDDDFYRTTNVIKFGKSNRQTHSIYDSEKTANDMDYIILNATSGKCYKIQTWSAKNDSIDTALELQTETGHRKRLMTITATVRFRLSIGGNATPQDCIISSSVVQKSAGMA